MSNPPKVIVISGANDRYGLFVQDLFNSLLDKSFKYKFDLGLVDLGLSEENRGIFAKAGVNVVPVQSDIDYPARAVWEKQSPAYRILTARPFLRRYFPGYDVYIWLDADVWAQTSEALDSIIEGAASSPAIHIACELDRCYRTYFEDATMWSVFSQWYQGCYGDDAITAAMTLKPMYNAGVFAMSKDSPVWDVWLKIYTNALQKLTELNNTTFMTDQLALNIAITMHKVPCVTLPALFNWLTYYSIPMLDKKTGLYVEPLPPYRPISQFHLTQHTGKERAEKIPCRDGGFVERPLLYRTRNG